MVWRSDSALVSINVVDLTSGPVSTRMGDHVQVYFLVPDTYLGM